MYLSLTAIAKGHLPIPMQPKVSGFIINRILMFKSVYNRKVRRITNAMLVRAVIMAIQDEVFENNIFEASNSIDPDFLNSYLALNDESLVKIINDNKKSERSKKII